jgi:hypothetical protein
MRVRRPARHADRFYPDCHLGTHETPTTDRRGSCWRTAYGAPCIGIGSGGRIRTIDLRIMSPASFHCSTPRHTVSIAAPSILVIILAFVIDLNLDRLGLALLILAGGEHWHRLNLDGVGLPRRPIRRTH